MTSSRDLLYTDTSLIRTLCSVPSVSVLERFDCSRDEERKRNQRDFLRKASSAFSREGSDLIGSEFYRFGAAYENTFFQEE